ncbi:hypothetical protein CYMTET_30866 [Cymbomonas tetramitiformis]|uniref:Uncharacterized protein n=1 Tax=Cymbomonas tetramitiformis TaxID=36881 RepID=A0AAE0KTR8_9CHLO|nr:hypothetical protein CYMTET_30866 [Cymbomonas tetramitiformis]
MPGGDVADWTWRGVMSGATELSAALRQLSGMHDENRGLTRELKELALQMERERDKASSSAPSTSSEDVSEDIGRLQNENRKLKEKLEEMERSGRAQQVRQLGLVPFWL